MKNRLVSILYPIVWPFYNLVHPCKVYGRENIPPEGALICANHTRMSDPLFIVFALKRKNFPRIMAKAELMRVPVLGWLLKKLGMFGVDRGKSDVTAIKEALRILKGNDKLLLFPQGTRYKDGGTGEAKTGAAMLALRTGVPILPVWLPSKKRWFRPTPVVFGEAYWPKAASQGRRPTPEDYRMVSDDLLERIMALSEVPGASLPSKSAG